MNDIVVDSEKLLKALSRAYYPTHPGVYDFMVYHGKFTIFAPRAPIMAYHAPLCEGDSPDESDFRGTITSDEMKKLIYLLNVIDSQGLLISFTHPGVTVAVTL